MELAFAGITGDDAVEVECDSEFIGVWVLAGGDLVVLYDAACGDVVAGGFMDVVAVGGQE